MDLWNVLYRSSGKQVHKLPEYLCKHLKKENRRSLACKIQQDVELMLELLEGTFYKKWCSCLPIWKSESVGDSLGYGRMFSVELVSLGCPGAFLKIFTYLFLAVLGLRCMWAFSSCNEWRLLQLRSVGFPLLPGFSCGTQALGAQPVALCPWGSRVGTQELRSMGSVVL